MNDEDVLNAHLDADPGDAATRLVLSDLLEEQGRLDEAEGQRWLVAVGKWPVRCPCEGEPKAGWRWWVGWTSDPPEPQHEVPVDAERGMPLGAWLYPTRREAEAVLVTVARRDGLIRPGTPEGSAPLLRTIGGGE